MVSSICSGAPIMATRRTGFRSLSENSSPRANSKSATPISASSSISWVLDTASPAVWGPRMIPAAM